MKSLHQVFGTADGRGHPAQSKAISAGVPGGETLRAPAATVERREPVGPRASSSQRAGWHWLRRRLRALDDSPLGDLIGAVSIWLVLILFLIVTA
ncbi:hypothetical protein [Paracoccus sp. (in: a-proteobacteria)]|uniref:hypothetical protein n=1 Tax=Paracoccus sp. TaxID=267 RepID=UPI00272B8D0B|nr:hypothetical protein [Paracoccus sp. (in: a-proteobacteria)]